MNISERKTIWVALSDFYLDTELQGADFKFIAAKIKGSPYTLKEVKQIDKNEVFPVLYSNLLSVAGIWSGFKEEWLIEEISKNLQKRTWFGDLIIRIRYARLKWMYADYWEKLERVLQEQRT